MKNMNGRGLKNNYNFPTRIVPYKRMRLNVKEVISNLIINFRNIIRKIPKRIKAILIAILILVLIIILIVTLVKESKKQKYVEYDGENLNESKYLGYKELIDELLEKHPNWTFTLFYTKLDWEEVIEN